MMYEPQHQQQQQQQKMKMRRNSSINEEDEQMLEDINLSGMSLDYLPNPSLNLAVIYKLDISNNNLESAEEFRGDQLLVVHEEGKLKKLLEDNPRPLLRAIPESLTARLLNLAILDAHSNQLKSLPNSMGCLSKLKILNVSGNLLESLPKTIETCRSLEEINANFNKLVKLPDTIGFELVNLKKLSVNSNKLAFLPYSISHLTNLRILDARLNCLRSLPQDLENLINLEILNVSQNFHYLTNIPYSIGLLISLTELDISYNKITILPDSIGCLKKLQKLSVEGNPLVSPKMEVMEQSLHVIKDYLSERMNGGSPKSPPKNKVWLSKFTRWATFNGRMSSGSNEEREGFVMPYYRSIDGIATPRNTGLFTPRKIFSPRSYFSRK